MSSIAGFHAVVPAGGAGTRLWPLSRRAHPKFLLDLTGSGRTLLQGTWDRLLPLTGPDGVVVVTGEAHAGAVRAQLPDLPPTALLTEPSGRDSMAAIGLAAALLRERHGDVVVGSFAADHVVRDPAAFHAAVREAVDVARAGFVVTLGIAADHPSTAFGYIESGAPLEGAPSARRVRSFAEKPDAATAVEYLATGRYRWNAGMFVVRAQVLLEHLERLQPPLHDGLVAIARAWDTAERAEVLAREWPRLTRIAIDHAVAEPVAADGGVAVVPAELGWDDVGDWRSLGALLPAGPDGVTHLGDEDLALVLASPGSVVVPGGERLVALLGVPDAVVVDTPDALLVTTTAQAQRLKEVVDRVPDALR
ncbi:mannose-1-phosphate guanylyltransferase [Georgenia sp. H159]|uniref:mannose-1-phosphate guanylyltransferase n=1 Tax=Georgenia sp. H159 TaxID=3076115 RepID=UPI002D798C29|nr:mannose-1-phosphate guanylyltransferase [Georgenia sp. H159]